MYALKVLCATKHFNKCSELWSFLKSARPIRLQRMVGLYISRRQNTWRLFYVAACNRLCPRAQTCLTDLVEAADDSLSNAFSLINIIFSLVFFHQSQTVTTICVRNVMTDNFFTEKHLFVQLQFYFYSALQRLLLTLSHTYHPTQVL